MLFPGMDPYLEDPKIWPGVHARLVVYLGDHLQSLLRPRYVVGVLERVFVEGPAREVVPDVWLGRRRPADRDRGLAVAETDDPVVVQASEVEVREPYLEILDRTSGLAVVTVIEVVSPSNKYPGSGRDLYLRKQREVRKSTTHLVEIDLLREGPHVLAVPEWLARGQQDYDYLICVNRAQGARDLFDLYPRTLRDRLPRIRVPLASGDEDVRLDVQEVLARTYELGRYEDRLDYGRPCAPPLPPADQTWATDLANAARGGQAP